MELSTDKSGVCVEEDVRHFLFLLKHAEATQENSACPLNAVNGDMVLGILVLMNISKDVPIIADWTITFQMRPCCCVFELVSCL